MGFQGGVKRLVRDHHLSDFLRERPGLPGRLFGQPIELNKQHRRPNMRMLASPSPSGFTQDRAFYRKVRVDLGEHPAAARRFELTQQVEQARGHGLTLKASLALLGLARST